MILFWLAKQGYSWSAMPLVIRKKCVYFAGGLDLTLLIGGLGEATGHGVNGPEIERGTLWGCGDQGLERCQRAHEALLLVFGGR